MASANNDNGDDGVTMGQFAQLAGLSLSAIRYHAQQGTIKRRPDGKWNPADAEALASARQTHAKVEDPRNAKLLKVRVLGGAVKTKRIKLSVQEAQAKSVERQPLEHALRERCAELKARVFAWPERYAVQLADELGADPATANAVLQEFVAIAFGELGDIEAEAMRYVSRGASHVG